MEVGESASPDQPSPKILTVFSSREKGPVSDPRNRNIDNKYTNVNEETCFQYSHSCKPATLEWTSLYLMIYCIYVNECVSFSLSDWLQKRRNSIIFLNLWFGQLKILSCSGSNNDIICLGCGSSVLLYHFSPLSRNLENCSLQKISLEMRNNAYQVSVTKYPWERKQQPNQFNGAI